MNVWAVHTVRPRATGRIEILFDNYETARMRAAAWSREVGVLAAWITKFTVNELGTRKGAAMFVDGREQRVPHVSDTRDVSIN